MKRKSLTLLVCLLACLALGSVGFAAWVITNDANAQDTGTIRVDVVKDARLSISAEITEGERIIFGAKEKDSSVAKMPSTKATYKAVEKPKEYNNKKEIYKESFEEWWSFFPKLRAGSKSEAYKKYVQVITKEHITPQDLLQRVKIYAASDEVKRGYASGAVRYFNDCKYNNIYGSAVKNTNSIPADIDLYDGKYFDFNLNRVVATKEDNPDWSKYNRATGEFDL